MESPAADWNTWAMTHVAKPFRKRAVAAAQRAIAAGATPEQAVVAAKEAERKRANYMATSALVLGGIGAAIGFFFGGLSIFTLLFSLASFAQGRLSAERAWQAWTGLGLALLGVTLFVVALILR